MNNKCCYSDCASEATKQLVRKGCNSLWYCDEHFKEVFQDGDVSIDLKPLTSTVKEEVKRMTKIGSFFRKLGDKADILQPKAEKAAIKAGQGLKEAGRKIAVVSLKGSLKATTEISNLLAKIQPKPKTEILDTDNAQE